MGLWVLLWSAPGAALVAAASASGVDGLWSTPDPIRLHRGLVPGFGLALAVLLALALVRGAAAPVRLAMSLLRHARLAAPYGWWVPVLVGMAVTPDGLGVIGAPFVIVALGATRAGLGPPEGRLRRWWDAGWPIAWRGAVVGVGAGVVAMGVGAALAATMVWPGVAVSALIDQGAVHGDLVAAVARGAASVGGIGAFSAAILGVLLGFGLAPGVVVSTEGRRP